MLKQKLTPIEASNIANLGSDLEKQIKANASKCERAWDGVGQAGAHLDIWRIEKFQVVRVPDSGFGKFYDGDSYIILHSWKKSPTSNALNYDVHFWLGEKTSQDEAGTAAYKTVELDDRLGGCPVQHREVQNHETPLFLSYFKDKTIEILNGGVESGFNHVTEKTYQTRLLQVKGTASAVRVTQVELKRDSLNSGDVFILDAGMKVYQFNGSKSSTYEKIKAGQVVRAIKDERGGKPECSMFAEGDTDAGEFWKLLGGEGPIKTAAAGGADVAAAKTAVSERKLVRLSDASGGKLQCTTVKTGSFNKADLDTNDVFIVDTGSEVFVWVGKKSNQAEKKNALGYAQKYITENNRPAYLPISRVLEGGENPIFNSLFADGITCSRALGETATFPHPCCPHVPGGGSANPDAARISNMVDAFAPPENNGYGFEQSNSQNKDKGDLDKVAVELFGFFANKVASKLTSK